jgi:sulfite exporter TauE/SafE
MTASLVIPVLAASLVGSVHCAGMCGGFTAFYAGSDVAAGKRRVLAHAAYNLGRLATYLVLGAIAGAIGSAIDLAGRAAGVGRIAGALAGGVMLVWALSLLMEHAGVSWMRLRLPRRIERAVSGTLARLRAKPPLLRAALLGLSSTLLPCGWLYAFAITASGTGSTLGGVAVMGFFWLGTVPMMLGLGIGVQHLSARLRRHLPVVTAVALFAVGLASVYGRINLPAFAADSARATLSGDKLPGHPCCHTH